MRKIVLFVLILAVAFSAGVFVLARKAPALMREAIARSINKDVQIEAIEYRFPRTFELRGFKILETREPFAGEICFSVDRVLLDVSPMSLSRKVLVLDSLDVAEALVVVRKRDGRMMHALSDAMKTGEASAGGGDGSVSARTAQLPLKINRFSLKQSRFQLADYDVQSDGFVIELDEIEAVFKDIAFPASPLKTVYHVEARLPQGRQQRAGSFRASGWTVPVDYETDALFEIRDLSLAYFKPYLAQVTPAEIDQGRLASNAALRIHERLFTANVNLELADLYFRSYEEGEELFGLKAEEILSFLKDSAGRLKFQIVLEWELSQRGVEKRAVVRRAIEQSLKKTLLSNVGNILERTLQKYSEPDNGGPPSDDWEDALKKVKKLFR